MQKVLSGLKDPERGQKRAGGLPDPALCPPPHLCARPPSGLSLVVTGGAQTSALRRGTTGGGLQEPSLLS